jgi:hypothetical protein
MRGFVVAAVVILSLIGLIVYDIRMAKTVEVGEACYLGTTQLPDRLSKKAAVRTEGGVLLVDVDEHLIPFLKEGDKVRLVRRHCPISGVDRPLRLERRAD